MNIISHTNPYNYFVIENFLLELEYKFLKEVSLASVVLESGAEYHDHYGMITNAEVLRKMAGKELRTLIANQFGFNVARNPNSVPQLRCTIGVTKGVAIHTDSDCGFNVAAFLHLTDWQSDMGGDLQIWGKNENGFELKNAIQPKANTLVVLAFSENSFHSVTPVVKDIKRLTLISEWSMV